MARVWEGTRRTANVRTRGRAAQVVQRVFNATADELSRVGYAAMRVEDVAARSGVNKTTIYRRWPTKADLVAATMIDQGKHKLRIPIDTGTLRGDLHASLLSAFELKPSEQSMLRIVQMERSIPEVDALARRFRDELHGMRLAMVHRGIVRGELPQGVDAQLVVDLVSAPVQRALLFNETIDARYIDRVLDVVLAGAAASASEARTPGGTRKRVSGGASKRRNAKRAGRTRPGRSRA
jgi:AcrR family transcriptional regulator